METKFQYIWSNGKTNVKATYTIEQLDNGVAHPLLNKVKPEIIARRQYLGLKDINGQELYEGGDIIEHWGETYTCEFEDIIYHKMNSGIFDGDFKIIGNVYEGETLTKRLKRSLLDEDGKVKIPKGLSREDKRKFLGCEVE